MPLRFLFVLVGVWLMLVPSSQAQVGNHRMKWIKNSSVSVPIDTLTLFPASLRILTPVENNAQLSYNPTLNTVQLLHSDADSVLVAYQVFPFRLGKPKYHRDPLSYDTIVRFREESMWLGVAEQREEFFATAGINKTGSITRGISFGNTQNVFVNSALNLQLEGQLSDDISLSAVISDQNVPFQPEGNTQQLQEFDKVYIQLASKKARLAAGDLVMQHPLWKNNAQEPSSFLRYYKNVQGVLSEVKYTAIPRSESKTSAGIAVSKGKFASMVLEASEGVQGPYRLRGPNNERFIIVLANSEQVYLDGRLLTRGFDFDYIIDYNLAEITFTPNTVITKFSRIRVDFEYSDRVYSRTNFTLAHQQAYGKWRIFGNLYSEKDNPRNPLTITLTEEDRLLLSSIGDSLDKALVPAVTYLDAYTANQILYEKKDTLIETRVFPIYIQSANPQKALYQLQFSEVGEGKGNYVLRRGNTANGKVYDWVAPVNGMPQGNYEPVKQIPTPVKKQMITVGTEYQVSQSESIIGEMAFSEKDVNLFSSVDGVDNKGAAWKIGYNNRGKRIGFLPTYEWFGGIDFERNSRNFSTIDRFRDIEFDRNWSARIDTSRTIDNIFNLSVGIRKAATRSDSGNIASSTDHLVYKLSRRLRGNMVNGWQQQVSLGKQVGRIQLSSNAFALNSRSSAAMSEWQRLETQVAYLTRFLVPGYIFSLDKNKISSLVKQDSVIATAMNFEEHTFFIKSNDTSLTKFKIDYSIRKDYLPVAGKILLNDQTQMVHTGLQTQLGTQNDINVVFTYRNLRNLGQPEPPGTEETIMGRIDWNGNWWNDLVRSEMTITTGTGRELKREYVFLPVPTGEGTHTWRDDNSDGKQDLNEFYEAINPDERNFAKFFVPTDEYIRAYTNTLNYRLNLTTPISWKESGTIKAFFAKFSSVSSWNVTRKITDGHSNILSRFIPVSTYAPLENLLSLQESLRSTVFFNRTHPTYGLDISLLLSNQKQLLTNGFESRSGEELKLNSRVNLSKEISFRGIAGKTTRFNSSDFLLLKNYRIASQQISPEITYQPQANFRLSGSYLFTTKKNILTADSPEKALFNQIGLDSRWSKVSKRTMSGVIKFIQIRYTGQVNSPLGYEMLEALQPGNNWTWSYNLQQRLSNGLQIGVSYEGRKSEMQRVIHIGRMQVSALF